MLLKFLVPLEIDVKTEYIQKVSDWCCVGAPVQPGSVEEGQWELRGEV